MNLNLTSIKVIKGLFKKYQIYPSKRLGQNFLVDQRALQKIIKAANLGPEDIILEIGPGIGTLTAELAKRVKKVVAIEKDTRMIEILKETLQGFTNIEIIRADILKLELQNLIPKNYKVVANLPYYITSPIIRKFLESKNPPKEMILMVQKEVAQRICALAPNKNLVGDKPRKMNLLAVSVQFYAKAKVVSYLSKNSFWPQPKVESAIIKITPLIHKAADRANYGLKRDLFFKIVRAGFSQPRKQILNNLSKMLKLDKEKVKSWLLKNNLQPNQRAETLTVKDWLKLTQSFSPFFPSLSFPSEKDREERIGRGPSL